MDEQQPVQPSVIPASATSPRLRKPLAIAFAVVSVLAAVEGYAFHAQIWPHSSEPTPTPTPVVQATSTPDPTVGWKTYTNAEYGFEFKYPDTWYLERRDDWDILSNYKDASKYDVGTIPSDLESIYVQVENMYVNETYESIQKLSNRIIEWESFTSQHDVKGIIYTSDLGEYGNSTRAVVLGSGGPRISFSLRSSTEDQKILLKAILSTFKFMDSVTRNYKLICMDKPEGIRAKYAWYSRFEEQIIAGWKVQAVCYNSELDQAVYLKSQGGYGGSNNQSQLGVYTISSDTFQKAPVQKVNSFSFCPEIKSWSREGIIRYECRGGDAGHGSSEIYEYSVSLKTLRKVQECTIDPTGEECTNL